MCSCGSFGGPRVHVASPRVRRLRPGIDSPGLRALIDGLADGFELIVDPACWSLEFV